MSKLPNFLVVGFPKCGTTSLHYYLNEHPEIFMPKRKELHFFTSSMLKKLNKGPGDKSVNQFHIDSFEIYQKYFKAVKKHYKAVGEVSPSYVNYPETIPKIKEKLGRNVKVIIVLRDPLKRAFSNYLHLVREGRETLSFYEALKSEEDRKNLGYSDFWYYKWNSLYSKKVIEYLNNFDNVYLMTNEQLQKEPTQSIQNLYAFLGVNKNHNPKNLSKQYNPGGLYKDNFFTSMIFRQSVFKRFVKTYIPITTHMKSLKQKILKSYEKPKPEIDTKAEKYLIEYFKDDVDNLKKKTSLDIYNWNSKLQ